MMRSLYGICGQRRQGKTTAIRALATGLVERGHSVAGVAQPARLEDGRVVGYDLVDLATQEVRPLAHRAEQGARPLYRFDAAGFEWAEERLQRAADFLLVDEIGWVEVEGGGHMPALKAALAEELCRAAVLGVRDEFFHAVADSLGAIRPWFLGSPVELAEQVHAWTRHLEEIVR
jgi:nucleoside-triphosphatase THEP1